MTDLSVERIERLHVDAIADPELPCPCGSSRVGSKCCLDENGLISGFPAAARPTPLGTGVPNSKCYASPLGGCSQKITGEHYLSRTILGRLTADGGQLNLSKFAWQSPEESKILSPDAVKANVLCKAHNEALSAYDAIGGRFVELLLRSGSIDAGGLAATGLFNGEDLERWFLKTLCGVVAMEANVRRLRWHAPIAWLKSLFGLTESMPSQMGLWLNLSAFEMFSDNSPSISATPIDNPNGADPLGLRFYFSGLEFVLVCSQFVGRSRYLPDARLRPSLLSIETPGYSKVRLGIHRYSPPGMHLRLRGRQIIGGDDAEQPTVHSRSRIGP